MTSERAKDLRDFFLIGGVAVAGMFWWWPAIMLGAGLLFFFAIERYRELVPPAREANAMAMLYWTLCVSFVHALMASVAAFAFCILVRWVSF